MFNVFVFFFFFFSSRRRHTRFDCDWSSDVCSSDLSLKPHLQRQGPTGDVVRPFGFALRCQTVRIDLRRKQSQDVGSLRLVEKHDVAAERDFHRHWLVDYGAIGAKLLRWSVCSLQDLWSMREMQLLVQPVNFDALADERFDHLCEGLITSLSRRQQVRQWFVKL